MPGVAEGVSTDLWSSAQQGHQHAAVPAVGLGPAAAPAPAAQPWAAGAVPQAAPGPQKPAPVAPAAAPLSLPAQAAERAALQADAASFAASALLTAERQQQLQRLQQLGAAQEAAALQQERQQGHAEQAQQAQQSQEQQEGEGDDAQHPLTVPVSAVAAGWAPDRSGSTPTGSGAPLCMLHLAGCSHLQLPLLWTPPCWAAARRGPCHVSWQSHPRPGAALCDAHHLQELAPGVLPGCDMPARPLT